MGQIAQTRMLRRRCRVSEISQGVVFCGVQIRESVIRQNQGAPHWFKWWLEDWLGSDIFDEQDSTGHCKGQNNRTALEQTSQRIQVFGRCTFVEGSVETR